MTTPALHYPHENPPEPGTTTEVAPGVFWLRMPLPFALDHINLWLLKDVQDGVDGWTIVDCGYGSDETCALWDRHFADTMAARPVHRIIVTHYHPDHVGNANWLHEKTGAPIWMTTGEYLSAHAATDDAAGFDRDNTIALYLSHGLASVRPDYAKAQAVRSAAFKRGVPSVPRRYIRMMDGDEIGIGGRAWRVYTMFGHAPEHASLFTADGNILIAGDQLLPRISTNVSVWGNQPEADPLRLFLTSFKKFSQMPSNTLVLPSHGRVFTGMHTRIAELQAHHAERLAELEAVIGEPKTAADVLATLFRRPLDDHQLSFAMGEAIAHLHYLRNTGRAVRIAGADGVYRFLRADAAKAQ